MTVDKTFFQLILDSVPISIAYVEKDETITFANQNYLDWFRVGKAELMGKKIQHITPDSQVVHVVG